MKLATICLLALTCISTAFAAPSPDQIAARAIGLAARSPDSHIPRSPDSHAPRDPGNHAPRDPDSHIPRTPDISVAEAAQPTMKAAPAAVEKRAVVTATVAASALKYRTCPRTSCTAVGQYSLGTKISVLCYTQANTTTVEGDASWARLTNGYYVALVYIDWPGYIDACYLIGLP